MMIDVTQNDPKIARSFICWIDVTAIIIRPATSVTMPSVPGTTSSLIATVATSMRGVNRELFPLARMTYPRGLAVLEPGRVPLGTRAFRSWILALGALPIDYDDLTFVALEPCRFLERSPMLTQREWRHERVVEPAPGGSIVTDRIRLVPRLAALGPLFALVFRLAFRLRHRNLRRIFGTASSNTSLTIRRPR